MAAIGVNIYLLTTRIVTLYLEH